MFVFLLCAFALVFALCACGTPCRVLQGLTDRTATRTPWLRPRCLRHHPPAQPCRAQRVRVGFVLADGRGMHTALSRTTGSCSHSAPRPQCDKRRATGNTRRHGLWSHDRSASPAEGSAVPVGDCAPRRQFGPTLGTDGLGPTWLTTNSVSAETAIPAVPPKPASPSGRLWRCGLRRGTGAARIPAARKRIGAQADLVHRRMKSVAWRVAATAAVWC